jgi:hypothetical protein
VVDLLPRHQRQDGGNTVETPFRLTSIIYRRDPSDPTGSGEAASAGQEAEPQIANWIFLHTHPISQIFPRGLPVGQRLQAIDLPVTARLLIVMRIDHLNGIDNGKSRALPGPQDIAELPVDPIAREAAVVLGHELH